MHVVESPASAAAHVGPDKMALRAAGQFRVDRHRRDHAMGCPSAVALPGASEDHHVSVGTPIAKEVHRERRRRVAVHRQCCRHGAVIWTPPDGKDRFGVFDWQVAVLYPACWCRTFCLLALMESADPRLISPEGFSP